MALSWRTPPLTQADADDRFMRALEDDTEDAPWMVMGDLQFDAASSFKHSLRAYSRAHGLGWYVASMVPIRYRWRGSRRPRQLAPDGFVALVPDHPRSAYDLAEEGVFPPFVLEVVSPSSVQRDEETKLQAYRVLGAVEYVLFTPRAEGTSTLSGYRRDGAGSLVPWPVAGDGSLWSTVLGLRLVVDGVLLLAETAEGERLLAPEQEALARREAEEARLVAERARRGAEQARQTEARARQEAEQAQQVEARARQEAERARQTEAQARREAEQARQTEARARQEAEQARQTEAQARREAEQARREADEARQTEALARQEADAARREAEQARREADAARRDVETENARLRQELDTLRSGGER